jgi:hypothetical protein
MRVRDALERFLEEHELPLYGALFLAALLLRLSALESAPLSAKEAAEAWGAMDLLRGGAAASSSALYTSLTAGVLFLAGPSHWAPRLLPALAGALAVLLPLLWRGTRGRIESILLALLLALSPSLWITSTMAGGTALGFLAAGFVLLARQTGKTHPLVLGLASGLAIAAGPVGWSGLAIAGVVFLVEKILNSGNMPSATEGGDGDVVRVDGRSLGADTDVVRADSHSPLLAGFLIGLLAGGTGLFFFPRGIGALAGGFSGWIGAFYSGWPRAGEGILLFLGYEPLALVFGMAGIILLWRGKLAAEDRFWGSMTAVAAVWVFLRPAAFPDEALWVILPLLVLGARALRIALESPVLEERPVYVTLQAAAVLVLAAFAVFSLATSVSSGSWLYLLLAAAGILGGLVPGLLYSDNLGGSIRASLTGLALAWFCILSVAQAGAGWNGTHERRASANELWQTETVAPDVIRLRQTLARISEWQTGARDELAVVIELPEQSALGWELLTYSAAEYEVSLDMLAAPSMLITPFVEVDGAVAAPRLTEVYRGQVFGYTERRTWAGWPPDFIRWLLYREGSVERGRVILWVRSGILVPEEGAVE